MAQHTLQSLFAPNSIAVITGDDAKEPILLALLKALARGDKRCPTTLVGVLPIWEGELPFKHCLALGELEAPCDLAIVAGYGKLPLETIVAQCGAAGIGSLLVLTWTGEPSPGLLESLRKHNVRLLGPNSFGLCRPKQGVYAWLGFTPPLPGRLALMSQSGTVASALVDWASWQGIGFSQIITTGYPADVMPSQILDYLSTDFESQSILMYLQNVGNPTRFLSSLRSAGRTKPVAVVTEHCVGADERVLNAALNRTGAVRGRRLNDLVAAASVMTNARRIKSGSLLIIGNGAGPGELAAQRASELNVPLLSPEGELKEKLHHVIAGQGSIGPVSTVWASCPSDVFVDMTATALADNQCCAVLLMLSPTALLDLSSLYDQVTELHRKQRKLIMVCLLGGGEIVAIRTRINEAGIPTFRTPESAIEGFQFIEQFQRNQQLAEQSPDSHALRQNINVEQARDTLKALIKHKNTTPTREEIREVFSLFNIRLSSRKQATSLLTNPIQLRVFQDKVFGPAIALSSGASSSLHEVVGLPPLNTLLARDLIQRVLPQEKAPELENLLLNLATLVCELPEIQDLTLGNVRLHESGSVYTELSIQLIACKHLRRYEHLAIQPYPRQWVSTLTLRNGLTATVRPVHPEDATMMADFVRGLSHETRYFRFISNISELTPRMLSSMSHIDYDREMAFMAVAEVNGKEILIGSSRYSDNFDDNSCEFAIVLGDEYQGLGLASYLMYQLFLAASDKGIRVMKGIVLAENKRMIQFCRRLGFTIQRDPDDIDQVIAVIYLTPKFITNLSSLLEAFQ